MAAHQTIGAIGGIKWARCGARDVETNDKFVGSTVAADCAACRSDEHDWKAFLEALRKVK